MVMATAPAERKKKKPPRKITRLSDSVIEVDAV
jgi:hypothetical protein